MNLLPPEITFLLGCLTAPQTSPVDVPAGDAELLLAAALKHGLLPLCLPRLQQLAALSLVQQEQIASFQQHHAVRAMRLTWELSDIIHELAAQGITAIAYKGPLLAQMLYGDITLRQFTDLDLMVAPADVRRAVEILAARGYRRLLNVRPQHEPRFLRQDCEYSLVHDDSSRCVDLHWAFTPRFFVARPDMNIIRQRVRPFALEGQEVFTFGAEDTLLMLALNASKDFWGRLIAWHDIATLLRLTPQFDWTRLWRESTDWRCQRILGLSLWLAHKFLAAPLPEEVEQRLTQDAALPRLARLVQRRISTREPGMRTIREFLLPAQVLPDWPSQVQYYARLGLQPSLEDWEFVTLPERWESLYYLTRPMRLLKKYVRQQP